MNANGLPMEVLVVLVGIAAVIVLWLALRFGRAIAVAVLVLGILAVAVLGAGALFTQASANRKTAEAAVMAAKVAQSASIGQTITVVLVALGIGAMGMVTVGALGTAGYFALRWRLAERGHLSAGQRHQALPKAVQPGQVIYILDEAGDGVDLADLDLVEWGW